jgi:hypothetical protein
MKLFMIKVWWFLNLEIVTLDLKSLFARQPRPLPKSPAVIDSPYDLRQVKGGWLLERDSYQLLFPEKVNENFIFRDLKYTDRETMVKPYIEGDMTGEVVNWDNPSILYPNAYGRGIHLRAGEVNESLAFSIILEEPFNCDLTFKFKVRMPREGYQVQGDPKAIAVSLGSGDDRERTYILTDKKYPLKIHEDGNFRFVEKLVAASVMKDSIFPLQVDLFLSGSVPKLGDK